ncbi:hypothetical protein [Streptomyces erythrochromogenes]|uniref:hypothetical protein n=1 Tax=Streptomyces erythrochromogenes TaxID=285574 RepID=UPI0037CFB1FD
MTDRPPFTLRSPSVVYAATDGDTWTAIDVMAVTDPRERAICRALLQHALTLLDASEPTNPNGSAR